MNNYIRLSNNAIEIIHPIVLLNQLKQQLLQWSYHFSSCCLLDNHSYPSLLNDGEVLFGAEAMDSFKFTSANQIEELHAFLKKYQRYWIFGNISYDLKSALFPLPNQKQDPIGFSPLFFFVPRYCFIHKGDSSTFLVQDASSDPALVWDKIMQTTLVERTGFEGVEMKPAMDRTAYIEAIEKIRSHILRGDCYELNFCQEFFAEGVNMYTPNIYQSLVEASPNPFAGYYRVGQAHLMCASPERYLKKKGDTLFSQPIKGTSARNLNNKEADQLARKGLYESTKERSEHVMVVDLVRNDLSIICESGTVEVEELYGLYRYPQVHQMISTIKGTLKKETTFWDILKASFPMGSMTGAPKYRVMQLVDQYEVSRRGLYSGAIGYFSPEGDFDFNVVIRSLLYNSATGYLSYLVGGGITWYSQAEKEYDECLLKAAAIRKVLSGNIEDEFPE